MQCYKFYYLVFVKSHSFASNFTSFDGWKEVKNQFSLTAVDHDSCQEVIWPILLWVSLGSLRLSPCLYPVTYVQSFETR